ncbi:conjugative transposon protein TraM [Moheibacter lacus]|uniref:Conjugative transposon protein TraM n=1 Tax=Moheibacter lacus TaxID=2745851 RepID=A0A838ZTR3_9FLAO|nr:conjugative transposon protein TraM [Moheibacter lacus]MBA5630367.1 conjugative transposon protein TraM [Moheibacter lacus]
MKKSKEIKTGIRLKDVREGKEILLKKEPVEVGPLLKKFGLYTFLGILFIGAMIWIFFPEDEQNTLENEIFNEVPQASETRLESDKKKAYEEDILREREQEKRKVMASLADFFQSDSNDNIEDNYLHDSISSTINAPVQKPVFEGYKNIQNSLGNFYSGSDRSEALKKEVDYLKTQLREKETEADPLETQLALMEKSYEMASKYFPGTVSEEDTNDLGNPKLITEIQAESKIVVSSLRKPKSVENLFNTPTSDILRDQQRNTIRACIHEDQFITSDQGIKIRLLEYVILSGHSLPKGTILMGYSQIKNGRLEMTISSVEREGNIFPVEISIYDLDGQAGLNIPNLPELNALTEISSKLGNSTGTQILMNSSASDQIVADLSKGAIQGISGYFSKKTKTPKIYLKAGHQLFLVPKN